MTNEERAQKMLKLALWRQRLRRTNQFYDKVVEHTALLVESKPVRRMSDYHRSEVNRAWVVSQHSVLPVENDDMNSAIERLFNSRLVRLTGELREERSY